MNSLASSSVNVSPQGFSKRTTFAPLRFAISVSRSEKYPLANTASLLPGSTKFDCASMNDAVFAARYHACPAGGAGSVNVTFAVPREHPNVVIPAEALIFNQQGLRVAVINPDKSIHLQPVTVYRDTGSTVELSDGLHGGENIVLNPPATLQEGGKVNATIDQKVADAR